MQVGVSLRCDLPGYLVSFVGVFPGDVEPEVAEGGFGQEGVCAAEAFHVVELVFDEAVGGFYVCLPGVR